MWESIAVRKGSTVYRTLFVRFLFPFALDHLLYSPSTAPVTLAPNVERRHASTFPSPLRFPLCSVHVFNPLIRPRPERDQCESSPASFPLPVRMPFYLKSLLTPVMSPPGMPMKPQVYITVCIATSRLSRYHTSGSHRALSHSHTSSSA
jgi:hypothetical protein